MLNAYFGHVMDYDETTTGVRSHLICTVLPSVLSLGEAQNASGKEICLATLIGYEVSYRIGQLLHPGWLDKGWHGTGIFGVFGVAVGCGKILGLNLDQMQHAVGIAASMASGLTANFGTMTKALHAGLAAKNGVLAALLAKGSVNANKIAIEGPSGYYRCYGWGEKINIDHFNQIGNPWGLETPGLLNPKLYPCCHGLATNIEYGLMIRDKYHFAAEDVVEIEIYSQPKTLSAMISIRYLDNGEQLDWKYEGPPRQLVPGIPRTGKEAKFSKEYAFSRALLDGRIALDTFSDEAVKDPVIGRFMKKIKVFHDSRLTKISFEYPEHAWPYGERMVIRLKDGRLIEEEEIFIQGASQRPLGIEQVKEKFYNCAFSAGLSREKSDKTVAMIEELEKVDNIHELIYLFQGLIQWSDI
jgi:2-methylcitrate dehydratase PrpD